MYINICCKKEYNVIRLFHSQRNESHGINMISNDDNQPTRSAGVLKYKSILVKLFNFYCKDEIDHNNSNKSQLDKNQFYIDTS